MILIPNSDGRQGGSLSLVLRLVPTIALCLFLSAHVAPAEAIWTEQRCGDYGIFTLPNKESTLRNVNYGDALQACHGSEHYRLKDGNKVFSLELSWRVPKAEACLKHFLQRIDPSLSIDDVWFFNPHGSPSGKKVAICYVYNSRFLLDDCRNGQLTKTGCVCDFLWQGRNCGYLTTCGAGRHLDGGKCACDPGYTGSNCEILQCLHGILNDYGVCMCHPTYHGRTCTQRCVYGSIREGNCVCYPQASGSYCETSHCGAHGVPRNSGCRCNSGFSGQKCETKPRVVCPGIGEITTPNNVMLYEKISWSKYKYGDTYENRDTCQQKDGNLRLPSGSTNERKCVQEFADKYYAQSKDAIWLQTYSNEKRYAVCFVEGSDQTYKAFHKNCPGANVELTLPSNIVHFLGKVNLLGAKYLCNGPSMALPAKNRDVDKCIADLSRTLRQDGNPYDIPDTDEFWRQGDDQSQSPAKRLVICARTLQSPGE